MEAFDWDRRRVIGKGGQAVIYLVSLQSNRSAKYIYKSYSREVEFERELKTVLFSHPSIIKIGCVIRKKLAVMMPFADGGDLWKGFPRSYRERSDSLIAYFVAQLVAAVERVHSAGFLHHDIKPHNLVRFLNTNRVALIDFGLSVPISKAGYKRGTKITMAPEVATVLGYERAPLHEGLDWWSVGVTIFMLHQAIYLDVPPGAIKRNRPISNFGFGFDDDSDVESTNPVVQKKGSIVNYLPCRIVSTTSKDKARRFERTIVWNPIPDTFSTELKSLLKRLLHPNPDRRRFHTKEQMRRLKAHPYFARVNWDRLY